MESLKQYSEVNRRDLVTELMRTMMEKGTDKNNDSQLSLVGQDGGSVTIVRRNELGKSDVEALNGYQYNVSGNVFQNPSLFGNLLVGVETLDCFQQRLDDDLMDPVAYSQSDFDTLRQRLGEYSPKVLKSAA